jgi:ubiquitin-like domain-containing CTD phosphatase 1
MTTEPDEMEESHLSSSSPSPTITLVAKYGKQRITLEELPATTTLAEVKRKLQEETRILTHRQKLVGLAAVRGGPKGLRDDLPLAELKIKGKQNGTITHQFILMGTPEEEMLQEPDDQPDVIDDFDLDFNAGSEMWLRHVANEDNLKKFTEKTPVHVMNPPRPGKPLLVLDLDHTLLDFSSRQLQRDTSNHVPGQGVAARMKRPYMDDFLAACYQHYDLVVWSQTSWRWLETKLIELGMVTSPAYKFCFVLDKTSMFTVVSTKRDGSTVSHHVKPLQIIWSKFPAWGPHNTVHVDDLERNFALNLGSGIKCRAYFRKKSKSAQDCELLGLSRYLVQLAESGLDFEQVDFGEWTDVVKGSKSLGPKNGDAMSDGEPSRMR